MVYLESEFIRDAADLSEDELTAPIMTREEFERQQALELYRKKAYRAGKLWDMTLNQLSGSAHKWKWDYMDYLEGIKYRDTVDVTLEEAKEEIMSYEEFAELKETEKEKQEQLSEMVAIPVGTTDEVQTAVVSENVDTESVEMEEVVSEVVADVPKVIDYTKLSLQECVALLPVPTDNYQAEYDAYCQRMGYTAKKMKSIRYKMAVYDEFREEYDYRKDYGVEVVKIIERRKGRGAK